MPTPRHLPWIGACLLGGAIVVVIGATCLYAASHGGPAWMAGREVSIFLKLSALTAVAVVVDICWRALAPMPASEAVDHAPTRQEITGSRVPGE